jgi:hypothetical protein
MEDFQGKYDGNQIDSRLDKVKDMVGATASGAGAAGLVPASAAEKRTAFLRGDGTWQDIDVHEPGFLAIISIARMILELYYLIWALIRNLPLPKRNMI